MNLTYIIFLIIITELFSIIFTF